MIPFGRAQIPRSRAESGSRAPLREALEADLSVLYLLAFVLTANHQDAGQCLHKVIEEALKTKWVFKGWVRSWIKRCVVTHAIRIASATPGQDDKEHKPAFSTNRLGPVPRPGRCCRHCRFAATLCLRAAGNPSRDIPFGSAPRLLNCTTEKVVSYRTRRFSN